MQMVFEDLLKFTNYPPLPLIAEELRKFLKKIHVIPDKRRFKPFTPISGATTQDLETWERFALLGGWQDWELGIEDEEKTKTKKKTSSNKKPRFVID